MFPCFLIQTLPSVLPFITKKYFFYFLKKEAIFYLKGIMQLPKYKKSAIIFFLLKWQYFLIAINEVYALSCNSEYTRSEAERLI